MYLYVCIVIILLSYFISRKDPKYRGLLIGVNFVVSVIYIYYGDLQQYLYIVGYLALY